MPVTLIRQISLHRRNKKVEGRVIKYF